MTDVTVNWLKETDSTNSDAHRHRHEASDFTVWAAEFQTAGRGQRGNSWESAKGENLTFSILFKPENFLSVRQFELSQVVALGVVDYLAAKGIDAKIKWPNDIYVEDRKICGILIENVLSGATLSVCIAGIGVNLNQTVFRSDAPNPTSLLLELQRSGYPSAEPLNDRNELMLLLQKIAALYLPLTQEVSVSSDPVSASFPTLLKERYLSVLYRRDELHTYVDLNTGETFRGYIRGIEKNACLRIETETGAIKSFAFKELKYIISQ